MSEELRNAIEMESWEDVDVVDVPDVSDVYADYISSNIY